MAEEDELKSKLMNTFMMDVSDVFGEHYQDEKAKAEKQMAIVERLVSTNKEFILTIALPRKSASVEAPVARLGKLWSEISQDPRLKDPKGKNLLPRTFRLELKHAESTEVAGDFKDYLTLKLKTVNANDEHYWTDTGRIYDGAFISSGESVKNR